MPTRFISVYDGPKITVSAMVKSPTWIPERVLAVARQLFIVDQILRPGPPVPGGVVGYRESTGLFADDDPETVEEFGEIPVLRTSRGNLVMKATFKKAGAVAISQEMIDRNDVDAVMTQINQVSNSMVKVWDAAMTAAMTGNTNIPTRAATAAWSNNTSSNVRYDLAKSIQTVVDQKRGFQPDTIIMPSSSQTDLLTNDATWKIFQGNVAGENPQLTGRLPANLFGLTPYVTYSFPAGTALICERNTIGFISDERPLQSSPLYEDRKRETWRSDTLRRSVIGVDQPLAGIFLTGI